MVEEWKNIKGYEGIYKISNLGKIVRIKGSQEHPMKIWNNGRYMEVRLSKGGKSTHFTLHRLLAVHFIPNPNNLRYVNHKDEDKRNNSIENLEWCTNRYNVTYSLGKKVIQLSKEGVQLGVFNSIAEASKEFNIPTTNISKCCKGIRKSAGNFIWRYE